MADLSAAEAGVWSTQWSCIIMQAGRSVVRHLLSPSLTSSPPRSGHDNGD